MMSLAFAAPVQTIEQYWSAPNVLEWSFHHGDDPAWADPDFDDNDWEVRRLPDTWPDGDNGYGWYRAELRVLPPEGRHVTLGVPFASDALDVYVDGVHVGSRSSPPTMLPSAHKIPVEAFADGRLVVALRLWQRHRNPWVPLSDPAQIYNVFIAHNASTGMVMESTILRRQQDRAMHLFVHGALITAGITYLLFWFRRRREMAYLCFGGWCLAHTVNRAGNQALELGFVSAWSGLDLSLSVLNVFSIFCISCFFVTMLRGWNRVTSVLVPLMVVGMLPQTTRLPGTVALFYLMDLMGFFVLLGVIIGAWKRKVPDVAATTLAGTLIFAVPLAAAAQSFGYASSDAYSLSSAVKTLGWLFPVFALSVVLANRQRRDAQRLQETYRASRRFVPFAFLELLGRKTIRHVERGDNTLLEMTVMFSDIRGFTTLSEKRSVDDNFAFINAYLAEMEPCIHAQGGFINQYLGDGIMALYPTNADAAVASAVAQQAAVRAFSKENEPIEIGIGLNTGPVMLGTIGGAERLDAGVVSDTQNLAARVEGMTKMYSARILLTNHTYDQLEDREAFLLRELDHVVAKGKSEVITLYEVLIADDLDVMRAKLENRYGEGLQAFRRGDMAEALDAFASCERDGAATLMADRCRRYLEDGVPEGWDGIVRLRVK